MRSWLKMNLKSLPYLLVFPVLSLLAGLSLLIQGTSIHEVFNLFYVLATIELFFIPWFALNLVYVISEFLLSSTLSLWKQILLKVFFSIVGVLLATGIMETFYAANGLVDDDVITLGSIELGPVTTNFVTNGFLALVIATPVYLSQARRYEMKLTLQEKALELQRLEKLKTQSKLEALQSKLNPHFLYNSLNTLSSLVYHEPEKAEKIILGLSELFRYSLQMNDSQWVPLSTEIKIVKTYLEIEKVRFEEALNYQIIVDESLLTLSIPKFLLQPLVENAVKHGTSKIEKGEIILKITPTGKKVEISIIDNGPPFVENPELGFGLSGTLEKLKLLYPGSHEFSFHNKPEKVVTIFLKAKT